MNIPNRTISGGIIVVFSVYFIFFSFISVAKIDYGAIMLGIFFLFIGVFIFFNKKEDEIEKIKDQKYGKNNFDKRE